MPPTTRSGSHPRVRPSADAAYVRRLAARRDPRAERAAVPRGESRPAPEERPEERAEDRRRGPLRRLLVPLVLAVVTLALGGLAAWFGAQAGGLAGAPSAQNRALADPAETSGVVSQAKIAVETLFSYDYVAPGPTTQAASRLLTGAAVKQYAALFSQVEKQAPAQKLVVTTAVTSAGVELLTTNTARVLVFATESDRKAGGTPVTAGAMLAVNMVRAGGSWKIEGIDTFG